MKKKKKKLMDTSAPSRPDPTRPVGDKKERVGI